MPHTKKAGPKHSSAKLSKHTYLLQPPVVNNGFLIMNNGAEVSAAAARILKYNHIHNSSMTVEEFQGLTRCIFNYQAGYEAALMRRMFPTGVRVLGSEDFMKPYHYESPAELKLQIGMREIPKMSIEQSHALSRRMFARTAEDMAQELYDDAE